MPQLRHAAPHIAPHALRCAVRLTPALVFFRAPALLQCARYGELAEVSELLAAGVSADAADADGRTALFLAAANGHAAVVQLLLANGAVRDAAAAARGRCASARR